MSVVRGRTQTTVLVVGRTGVEPLSHYSVDPPTSSTELPWSRAMESSQFRCQQTSSTDSDGGPAVPGGIALQRLNGDPSTDDGRTSSRSSPNSQRGSQSASICPAVHVVTDFCPSVTATDTAVGTHGLYWFLFHRLLAACARFCLSSHKDIWRRFWSALANTMLFLTFLSSIQETNRINLLHVSVTDVHAEARSYTSAQCSFNYSTRINR